jgi:hypothetical protein
MSGDDVRNLITVITALVSFLVAILTAVLSYVFNRKSQHDLEKLRAELEEKRRERDAVRDYEYEARKRLYHECGPLLLQLVERADSALRSVRGLARSARQGHLGPVEKTWLDDQYYYLSTIYWLFSPLTVVKLLQRRLTLLDFSLDRRIYIQYSLAKEIYDTFAADFRLAAVEPVLGYDPESDQAGQKRAATPQSYWKQGIPRGKVDIAVDALLAGNPDEAGRIKSFGEFEQEYLTEGSAVNRAFRRFDYLLQNFHPRTRPVFWRLLVTQAHLYQALLQPHDRIENLPLQPIPEKDRAAFDWRQPGEQVSDKAVLQEPFDVALAYLRERLQHLLTAGR